jgi:hypothetical protein
LTVPVAVAVVVPTVVTGPVMALGAAATAAELAPVSRRPARKTIAPTLIRTDADTHNL